MSDALSSTYAGLLAGTELFIRNPVACSAVDLLRIGTVLLTLLLAARLAAAAVADRRLRRRSPLYSRAAAPELHSIYLDAARRLGVLRAPPLHRCADVSPLVFTTGFLRPAVFIAPAAVAALTPQELRAVLMHELVHVRRRDNLRAWVGSVAFVLSIVVLLQSAALYVLFFQLPLRFGAVHATLVATLLAVVLTAFQRSIWPRLLFRRELSCDDRVVEVLRAPVVLAAALIRVWRLQQAHTRGPGAGWVCAQGFLLARPSLEERVRRLLRYEPPRRRRWPAGSRIGSLLLRAALFGWSFRSASADPDGSPGRSAVPSS